MNCMTQPHSGTAAFRAARDLLLRHREDFAAAEREFSWPRLSELIVVIDASTLSGSPPSVSEEPGCGLDGGGTRYVSPAIPIGEFLPLTCGAPNRATRFNIQAERPPFSYTPGPIVRSNLTTQ